MQLLAFGTNTTFNDRLLILLSDNDILTVSTGKSFPLKVSASCGNIETLEIFAGPDMPLSQILETTYQVINFDLKGFTGLKTVSVTGGTKAIFCSGTILHWS